MYSLSTICCEDWALNNITIRLAATAEVSLLRLKSKSVLAYRACQNPDGTEDLKKGTQLLEVYALEIQMYTEQKNTKKLKSLYHKALYIKSAIPHPRIMGIIRECGGKMHMHERIWSEAATDFFEVRQSAFMLAIGGLPYACTVFQTEA